MDVRAFTEAPEVLRAVQELRTGFAGKEYSDVIDEAGHQYVDLVMEGGGVLGIALVGYTYVLEQAGIRFMGVGGTSAGSINALLVAALGDRAATKSEQIAEALAAVDMFSFVDGDGDARDLIRAVLDRRGKLVLAWKGVQVLDDLRDHLGMNSGHAFLGWLTALLMRAGVRTTADLENRLAAIPPGLRLRDGTPLTAEQTRARLALVAAEISTETKVEFPRMAPLFWQNPASVPPALYVRASMSIPFFFYPFVVNDIPQGESAAQRWNELASFTGGAPARATFVDGGVMSNFPIDLFHAPLRVPSRPTFGAQLGTKRNVVTPVNTPGQLALATFNSARHCLDYDFITRNPDYRRLVCRIETRGHNWLNFRMSDEEKIHLFVTGAQAAASFLADFDWQAYKKIRADLAEAHRTAAASGAAPVA